jgi:glycine/D-amino acid oxidase-like deaminating enzyme
METSSADVAIVGAGLIGSSIAWRLSQAGARVTLFDAGRVGGEASSAGAGMLSPGGESYRPSVWLDLGVESMRLYPTFIDELRSETNLAIDFRFCSVPAVLPSPDRAKNKSDLTVTSITPCALASINERRSFFRLSSMRRQQSCGSDSVRTPQKARVRITGAFLKPTSGWPTDTIGMGSCWLR